MRHDCHRWSNVIAWNGRHIDPYSLNLASICHHFCDCISPVPIGRHRVMKIQHEGMFFDCVVFLSLH
jgi:hypothetical protein